MENPESTYNGEIIGVDYMLVEVPILENEDENIEIVRRTSGR